MAYPSPGRPPRGRADLSHKGRSVNALECRRAKVFRKNRKLEAVRVPLWRGARDAGRLTAPAAVLAMFGNANTSFALTVGWLISQALAICEHLIAPTSRARWFLVPDSVRAVETHLSVSAWAVSAPVPVRWYEIPIRTRETKTIPCRLAFRRPSHSRPPQIKRIATSFFLRPPHCRSTPDASRRALRDRQWPHSSTA